tara:strand:- start:961 stop:1956 length:996 start_codon:yes stop_codon:yes gene_type:complete
MNTAEPPYIALYHSGELKKRAKRLEARLASCDICPRKCGINRLEDETQFCHSGRQPIVASFCAHHGEEPALSGSCGSGTIFFGNCNLRCLYCQNYQISQNHERQRLNKSNCYSLAEHMLYLQNKLGCHNINFVSPSHFVPQIVQAVLLAVPMGLRLPLVYNTNSYDSIKTLRELNGIISIYLPDLKYASDVWAKRLSQAPDYIRQARNAIKEMFRQAGELLVDESGIAQRGVIIRHLILPNGLAGSEQSLAWLATEVSPKVALSLMSQYHPIHQALKFAPLSRAISLSEYKTVLKVANGMGLENGWRQEMGADRIYLPDFKSKDHPFASKR